MNILVFNPGSSSLKFGCYEVAPDPTFPAQPSAGGRVEGIGSENPRLVWDGSARDQTVTAVTAAEAVKEVVSLLGEPSQLMPALSSIEAVGCRVVHGGDKFDGPELVTDRVLSDIRELAQLAPLHNSSDADLIEKVCAAFPPATGCGCVRYRIPPHPASDGGHLCSSDPTGRTPSFAPLRLSRDRAPVCLWPIVGEGRASFPRYSFHHLPSGQWSKRLRSQKPRKH